MRIVVYGLWHLGSVTAACTAAGGHHVTGLDADEKVIADLRNGKAPIREPGLDDMIARQLAAGNLEFTTDAKSALGDAEVLWVCFDTPVTEQDEADVDFLNQRLDAIADALRPGTLVLISSQVPVGFTASLAQRWKHRQLHFAYSPENLRLGTAIEAFTKPDRIVVGSRHADDQQKVAELFKAYCRQMLVMSIESAEMAKHCAQRIFRDVDRLRQRIGQIVRSRRRRCIACRRRAQERGTHRSQGLSLSRRRVRRWNVSARCSLPHGIWPATSCGYFADERDHSQ